MNFAKSLVGIIFDKSADISDREDALTDLSDYTDDFVIDALIELILDFFQNFNQIKHKDTNSTLAFFKHKLSS